MDYMFAGCEAIEKLDLSSFDTSRVTCMASMFSECFFLQKLTLGEKFVPCGDMSWIFGQCTILVVYGACEEFVNAIKYDPDPSYYGWEECMIFDGYDNR